MSALITYVRDNGFVAPDPALYSRLTSSLSLSLVDQTKAVHSMSAFCAMSRRSHFMKFLNPAVTEGQKARLLGSNPFVDDLFDPFTLSDVISNFEGATATTSHLDVSRAVSRGFFSSGRWNKRKRDASPTVTSAQGSPAPSAVSSEVVASLFEPPSKGTGSRPRGGRGGGRGAQRG